MKFKLLSRKNQTGSYHKDNKIILVKRRKINNLIIWIKIKHKIRKACNGNKKN